MSEVPPTAGVKLLQCNFCILLGSFVFFATSRHACNNQLIVARGVTRFDGDKESLMLDASGETIDAKSFVPA